MPYVIGCDIGTQSAKAVLVSFDGQLIAEAAADYAVDYPQALWAEQPAQRWIDALHRAVRGLLGTAGVDAREVRAFGTAAQVDGVVPIDADGRPLHPAIIWMDRRAAAQCQPVRDGLGVARAFELTGLNLDASHVAPKIRWLADARPEIAERASRYLLPGSFIAHHLTGEFAVDYSNASSTLLMDVRTREWSAEMCRAFGIDAAQLAPIRRAADSLGTLRPAVAEALGLPPETRVMVGSGDEHAACLGAGVAAPGLVGDIAGTAEPVCAASPRAVFDPTRLVETHCHADPELWLLENPGFVSGGNFRWYRDHFGQAEVRAAAAEGGSAYALLDAQAAEAPPGSDGVIFLPCLMGAMAPTWNEAARGVFLGFSLSHTRAHFTRAVLEGSAYAVRDITAQMQAIGLSLAEMRVMGGGARSPLWNQIKADVTGLPVAVPRVTETTALGAALLALVGAGAYGSLAEAGAQAVRIAQRFDPQPAAQARYAEHYQMYRQTYFALLPVFEASAGRAR